MINGVKEYMLSVLRNATDEERRAAQQWVAERSKVKVIGSVALAISGRHHVEEEDKEEIDDNRRRV